MRTRSEACLRLKTLPGEQAQVDWGYFGKLTVGNAERTLMAFVMVLSCSAGRRSWCPGQSALTAKVRPAEWTLLHDGSPLP